MPGFGPASAPVATCGILGFLAALSSYKIDYNGVKQSIVATFRILGLVPRLPFHSNIGHPLKPNDWRKSKMTSAVKIATPIPISSLSSV